MPTESVFDVSSKVDSPTRLEAFVRRAGWLAFQAIYRIEFLVLDLLTLPGSLTNAVLQLIARLTGSEKLRRTGLMINAQWHVEFVCRMCPATRRNTRDPNRQGSCPWNYHWRRGNYDIPPDFGLKNYARQYYDGETNLENYQHLVPLGRSRILKDDEAARMDGE